MIAPYVSIIIPTKNAGDRFNLVLKGIFNSKVDFDYEVIIVDSGSTDNTKAVARNYSAGIIEIEPLSFSHGGARNIGADNAKGEILVYLSQDAVPKDADWMAMLVKSFEDDKDTAGVFGRQIPNTGASMLERFFLEYTYPGYRIAKGRVDSNNCALWDILFSNVNSAIRKSEWEENKFDEKLIMSEDQAWSKNMLIKGKKIIYEPNASVYHSHNYTIRRIIMRNFDSGLSLKDIVRASVKRNFLYELKYIGSGMSYFFNNRRYVYILIFFFYESFRVFGFLAGRHSRFLPVWVKRNLSENKAYWPQAGRFSRYLSQFLKNAFAKNKLGFLILFVTSRCNCRCSICFYWRSLNTAGALTVGEIKKISRSLGEFRTLLLSGGEPFLREDLFEVCRPFIENNKVSELTVPTNGTLTKNAIDFCTKILERYPKLTLSLSVSLDGFRGLHDETRGREGVFDKAIETLNALSKLKSRYKNFELIINTVITDRNAGQLESFMDFVFDNFNVDYQDFELLRGDYKDEDLRLPDPETIKFLHRLIVRNRRRYLRRRGASMLEDFATIGLLKLSQDIKERALAKKRPLFICSAGKNIGVIDANGDVKLCELLPAVGNLKDKNYDFPAVWKSPQAKVLIRDIRKGRCSCTHVCFIKLTASRYFKTVFYLIHGYLSLLPKTRCMK